MIGEFKSLTANLERVFIPKYDRWNGAIGSFASISQPFSLIFELCDQIPTQTRDPTDMVNM